MRYWVGVDWGQREHAVCVVDESGAKCWEGTVAHSQEALAELVERLEEFSEDSPVPVAVERPDGLLIDALRAAGHPVVPIPPQALRAFRPRYQRTGAKSDPADAFLLAEILRTDGHRFQALREDSDELRALRAVSRMRCDLVAQRTALTNQLRSFLDAFWPGDCPLPGAEGNPRRALPVSPQLRRGHPQSGDRENPDVLAQGRACQCGPDRRGSR